MMARSAKHIKLIEIIYQMIDGNVFRLYLAALHYNENSTRLQAVTVDGRPRFTLRFPKSKKGDYSIRKEQSKATYGKCIYYNIALCNACSAYVKWENCKFRRQGKTFVQYYA